MRNRSMNRSWDASLFRKEQECYALLPSFSSSVTLQLVTAYVAIPPHMCRGTPGRRVHRAWPRFSGVPASVTTLKTYVTMLRKAFPDLHATLEVLVAEGSLVAGRMTETGTQLDEFLGIPATGKHMRWTETHMARYADGKLVEHWVDADHLGILRQLEALPPPGQEQP